MPNFLFQKPSNSSVPNVHSQQPKNQLAPRRPKVGYNQKTRSHLLNEADPVCSGAMFST